MESGAQKSGPFYERYAWVIVFGLALLLSLSSLAIVATGANPPRQFETDTGIEWARFAADYPTVATLVSLQELLIGIGYFAFSTFSAIIAATKFRAGERWAWVVLWLYPVALAAAALQFFTHEQAYVGYYYLGATVIAALGLILPIRRFMSR